MNPVLDYLSSPKITSLAKEGLYPNFLASLILASDAIEQCESEERFLPPLFSLFGDQGVFSLHENLPEEFISDSVLLCNETTEHNPLALAYLSGISGSGAIDFSLPYNKEQSVYERQRRIFGNAKIRQFCGKKQFRKITCIIGQKSSGKTTILDKLRERGEVVLEIYKCLDDLVKAGDSDAFALPKRSEWNDEPLRLVHRKLNLTTNPPDHLYVGSLLRLKELDYLSNFGRLELVLVEAPNMTRHLRARERGRTIEKSATDEDLVKLDAHRAGFWPGYEFNDLGSLMDLATYRVNNSNRRAVELLQEMEDHNQTDD